MNICEASCPVMDNNLLEPIYLSQQIDHFSSTVGLDFVSCVYAKS
jgi:hypothetical protein